MTVLLLASLALAAPVPKDQTAELKWKFTQGDTFYMKCVQESSCTAGPPGGASVQSSAVVTTYAFKLKVLATSPKSTLIEVMVESIKDGEAPNGGNLKQVEDKEAAGLIVILNLDSSHQITRAYVDAEQVKVAQSRMIDERVRYRIGGLIRSIPGKTLSKGEKWTAETAFAQFYGTESETYRGTVDGITDGVAKLAVEVDRAWNKNEADKAKAEAAFAYDSLAGTNGERTVWFDTKTGRVKAVEDSYTTTGEMKRGGPGLQVVQKIKVKTTVSDQPPKDE
jgi:hypothetical protein